ncbi:hypothetical protein [Persephonella sp.]
MDGPITAYISAAAFAVVSILIIGFLIKEMVKYYSRQNNGDEK